MAWCQLQMNLLTDEGNCINAEFDQYFSEPLISRHDDLASWWEHAQASTLVDTVTKIPGTTTCQRGSSVHLESS